MTCHFPAPDTRGQGGEHGGFFHAAPFQIERMPLVDQTEDLRCAN